MLARGRLVSRRRSTHERAPRHWNGKTTPTMTTADAIALSLGLTALALAIAFGSLSLIGITL